MRIGYDTTGLSLNAAGERRYVAGLLGALAELDGLCVRPLTLSARRPGHMGQRLLYQAATEFLYYPLVLGPQARRDNVDLVHHPRPLVTPVAGLRIPAVVTVHDVLALTMPEHFSVAIAQHFRWLARAAVARAARVIAVSSYTQAQLVERLGVPAARTVVIASGVEDRFRPTDPDPEWLERRFGIDRPYVLCVGTLEPRKNLRTVIKAFERAHGFEGEVALVVAGARGWKTEEIDAAVDRTSVRLIATGYVDDDDLVRLYGGATCFVFPSLGEGFGFPVLEAMACGAPVITANSTSLPEVAGDAALLVDPTSVEATADAIEELIHSPERRRELRERGLARAGEFSWRACAHATADVYREVAAASA